MAADNLLASPGESRFALHMVQESGFGAGACSVGGKNSVAILLNDAGFRQPLDVTE